MEQNISEILPVVLSKEVVKIAESKAYMGSAVGYSQTEPELWKVYKELKKKAKIEELVLLCEHVSPVVRCYAFQALVEGCYKETGELIELHADDSAKLDMSLGCLIEGTTVNDFFQSIVSEDSYILSGNKITIVEM
ncbi:hypothetical protein [Putridiphycobacter roseus]|uniref:hypothetical protein n=1 Tax=Putridiphycobacter roseus TaxID=2219161 RepID=UPI0011B440C6|nr:hypothetical protein [Putridiphycobacter roseus]